MHLCSIIWYHTLPFFVTILSDVDVRIELIQESLAYEDGRLLAWFESSARDFLYPYPLYSTSYGTHDREILLERTLAFPVCLSKLFVHFYNNNNNNNNNNRFA